MNKLKTLSRRLPVGMLSLAIAFSLLLSSCAGRSSNGNVTIFGVFYIILAVAAFLSLIKQDWSTGKKIIWGLIIWFFPFGGSIIYFLFSGRR